MKRLVVEAVLSIDVDSAETCVRDPHLYSDGFDNIPGTRPSVHA